MATIRIEGSTTSPNTFLAPGARITVERTPFIAKMLRNGYVLEVEPTPAEVVESWVDPLTTTMAEIAAMPKVLVDLPDALADAPYEGVPLKSASKSTWQDFLADNDIEFQPNYTKLELIQIWEHHNGGTGD